MRCGIQGDATLSSSTRLFSDNRNSSMSSRVINGIPTTDSKQDFPWMAKVYLRIKRKSMPNDPDANTPFNQIAPLPSTGSIITHKTILTCGHCVCNYKDSHNERLELTCKERIPMADSNNVNKFETENVNVENTNEIYYTIGSMYLIQEYDKNVKVYVYDYDPTSIVPQNKWISRNGDIAVVVNTRGLGLANHGPLTPICLPSQNMFLPDMGGEKLELNAQLVGSGTRREIGSWFYPDPRSACFTNEGVILNSEGNRRVNRDVFLPCAPIDRNPKYEPPFCYELPSTIDSFSPNSNLAFARFPNPRVTSIKNKQSCSSLWTDAVKAYNKENPLKSIKDTADRIMIHESGRPSTVCYNAKKLGQYGVCKTLEQSRNQRIPVEWGFCSRACTFPSANQVKEYYEKNYEHMEARYLEDTPADSVFMEGQFHLKHINNV